VARDALDLAPTRDLLATLERRFDTLVLAGTIKLTQDATGTQEQRVVRVTGHDLIQAGLVALLAEHCRPQRLAAANGMAIGDPHGG
jgi:hypothetical protein